MTQKRFLKIWLRWYWVASPRRRSEAGFTLIELLISIAIGSVIVSTLLFAVVELLRINQRESARTETQREMQLALDFISNEVRESVFVYDGDCLTGVSGCRGVVPNLPNNAPANATPVLAFWRLDDLPDQLQTLCETNAASFNSGPNVPALPAALQGVPCLSRRMYTLVVYYITTDTSNPIWSGRARILRYEIPPFNAQGQKVQGWADPTQTANTFLGWPFNASNQNLQATWGGAVPPAAASVLVDYVDRPTVAARDCPQDAAPAAGVLPTLPAYVRSPTATVGSNSFYACVRGGGVRVNGVIGNPPVANNPRSSNQSVALFLRGNAAGRGGIPATADAPFDMQTVVLTRSSLDKEPTQ